MLSPDCNLAVHNYYWLDVHRSMCLHTYVHNYYSAVATDVVCKAVDS